MLSVLIPVYNWNITVLVKEIHEQCVELGIVFEIIALDDLSSDLNLKKINAELILPNYKFVPSEINRGNAETRNELSRLAKFDWLIFLDADVKPSSSNFIKKYISFIDENHQNVVYPGGLLYLPESRSDGPLRWEYGVKLEVQSAQEAQKNPYLNFRSCNFMTTKYVMYKSPFVRLSLQYGLNDTNFSLSLEKHKVEVIYVDNPVYHLGLETNEVYVGKQKSIVQNAYWMIKNRPEVAGKLRIISFYNKIKRWGFVPVFSFLFKQFEPILLKNLLSQNPSVFILQLYKLGYLCTLKTE